MTIEWISSSPEQAWKSNDVGSGATGASSSLWYDGVVLDEFQGFGGCFNELGWKALQLLDQPKRRVVLEALFSEIGCAFDYCRLPIGARDYA